MWGIYQSYCVFSLLFTQKISTKHDITSTEISYQFLALKALVFSRNKATNSSTSTDPFSAATKTLVLGNLLKFKRFAVTFARKYFAFNYNEKNKKIVIFSSSLSLSGKLPVRRRFAMSSLKTLNKLPSTRAFSAAEKWTVRSTGGGGFISQ